LPTARFGVKYDDTIHKGDRSEARICQTQMSYKTLSNNDSVKATVWPVTRGENGDWG